MNGKLDAVQKQKIREQFAQGRSWKLIINDYGISEDELLIILKERKIRSIVNPRLW